MSIPAQMDEIAIHIHSVEYALKCRVCGINSNRILASPVIDKVDMFQLNDPVVCMYMDNGNMQFKSGKVKAVSDSGKTVEILVAEHYVDEERRIFERYPASMYVSARRKFSGKRLHLVAKNISEYGLEAISPIDLDIDEWIDIDLITGKYMFYFVGKVIWKHVVDNGFEYGFQLTHFDVATKLSFEAFLGKLKEVYSNMYLKAR